MATNFPASLDTLTNPTSSDSLSSPSHSAQHANVNDAVEALQAKVGADSSAVTSSLDYKVAQLETLGNIQTYTPTWTATGGTPTIGNGTLSGKYAVINNWCVGQIRMVLGSTSSFSGTNEWRWSLPVAAVNPLSGGTSIIGAAHVVNAGIAGYRGISVYIATNKCGVYVADNSPFSVAPTVPFTMGTSDEVNIEFGYEVA